MTSWGPRQGDKDRCSNNKCDLPFLLNATVNGVDGNPLYGVRLGDGDTTGPLVSLGHPCVGGWSTKELNPSCTKVITREYRDKSIFQVNDPLRGGPQAAIHVDILGIHGVLEDIMRIVTGPNVEKVEQRVISHIEELSKKIEKKLFLANRMIGTLNQSRYW